MQVSQIKEEAKQIILQNRKILFLLTIVYSLLSTIESAILSNAISNNTIFVIPIALVLLLVTVLIKFYVFIRFYCALDQKKVEKKILKKNLVRFFLCNIIIQLIFEFILMFAVQFLYRIPILLQLVLIISTILSVGCHIMSAYYLYDGNCNVYQAIYNSFNFIKYNFFSILQLNYMYLFWFLFIQFISNFIVRFLIAQGIHQVDLNILSIFTTNVSVSIMIVIVAMFLLNIIGTSLICMHLYLYYAIAYKNITEKVDRI